jgi:hypothetical protein
MFCSTPYSPRFRCGEQVRAQRKLRIWPRREILPPSHPPGVILFNLFESSGLIPATDHTYLTVSLWELGKGCGSVPDTQESATKY